MKWTDTPGFFGATWLLSCRSLLATPRSFNLASDVLTGSPSRFVTGLSSAICPPAVRSSLRGIYSNGLDLMHGMHQIFVVLGSAEDLV